VAAQRAPVAEPPGNRAVDEALRDRIPSVAPPAARTQEPAATPAPTGTVFAQSDLPDAVRTQLPVLKIAGATYSANPMHRMAIVNGQVLHEGDVAAPGLMLEKIEPTRTIWSFKGYRYGLASQ
jgi:general secretion pathway protein B